MKTAGQILKEARLKKRLELEDAARITRIRTQFLSFIEADDYGQLPNGTVARGFIRNYCEFLELSPQQVLAVLRRDFIENDQGRIIPKGMVEPVNHPSFWTPRTTLVATFSLVMTLFAAYLVYQYRVLVGPPPLELTEPVDRVTIGEPTVEVVGRTDPEATVAVNGQLIVLDKGGQFMVRLPVKSGENPIEVIATSKSGRSSQIRRVVLH